MKVVFPLLVTALVILFASLGTIPVHAQWVNCDIYTNTAAEVEQCNGQTEGGFYEDSSGSSSSSGMDNVGLGLQAMSNSRPDVGLAYCNAALDEFRLFLADVYRAQGYACRGWANYYLGNYTAARSDFNEALRQNRWAADTQMGSWSAQIGINWLNAGTLTPTSPPVPTSSPGPSSTPRPTNTPAPANTPTNTAIPTLTNTPLPTQDLALFPVWLEQSRQFAETGELPNGWITYTFTGQPSFVISVPPTWIVERRGYTGETRLLNFSILQPEAWGTLSTPSELLVRDRLVRPNRLEATSSIEVENGVLTIYNERRSDDDSLSRTPYRMFIVYTPTIRDYPTVFLVYLWLQVPLSDIEAEIILNIVSRAIII